MRVIFWFIAALVFVFPRIGSADDLSELMNFYRHSDRLLTSGQPKEKDFSTIAAAGVQVVVNMAPANLPLSIENERELARIIHGAD